LGLPQL